MPCHFTRREARWALKLAWMLWRKKNLLPGIEPEPWEPPESQVCCQVCGVMDSTQLSDILSWTSRGFDVKPGKSWGSALALSSTNKVSGLSLGVNSTDSDRRLSVKLLPTFATEGCRAVSTVSYGRNLRFLDWSRYFFFQVAPQLHSWGWMDSFPDPLLLGKSGSSGNLTQTPGSVVRNSDH
jgi:hypothetical protein